VAVTQAERNALIALATRIDALPAYNGSDLGAKLYQQGQPSKTATRDVNVILIEEKWRAAIATALRVSVLI
jgi:hypothetical protein